MQRTSVRGFLARFAAPLWPMTLSAAAAGAVIGAAALPTSGVTAAATIGVDPPIDANQLITGTQPFPDSQPDYLAGEMVYLRSAGFADAVAERLNEVTPPTLSAALNGDSNLVTISATADTGDEAVRDADAAVQTYMEHLKEQARARYQPALDAVNATIPRLEQAARAAAAEAMVPYEPTDELVQLYFQRTSLEVQLQRDPAARVVEPAGVVEEGGALPLGLLGAVGGALAGALLGLGGALLWRHRTGVLTSPEQVDAGIAPLLPVLRVNGHRIDQAAARALYAQLPVAHRDRILVVGATTGSGTTAVAEHLAHAGEEHGPVQLVDLRADGLPQDREGVTVVEGGALHDSPALPDAAARAGQIVVAARLGHDTVAELAAVIRAMAQYDAPVAIVCTRAGVFASLPDPHDVPAGHGRETVNN